MTSSRSFGNKGPSCSGIPPLIAAKAWAMYGQLNWLTPIKRHRTRDAWREIRERSSAMISRLSFCARVQSRSGANRCETNLYPFLQSSLHRSERPEVVNHGVQDNFKTGFWSQNRPQLFRSGLVKGATRPRKTGQRSSFWLWGTSHDVAIPSV